MPLDNNKIEEKNIVETCAIETEDDSFESAKFHSTQSFISIVAKKVSNLNFWIYQRTGKYNTVEKFLEELPKGETLVDFAQTFDKSIPKAYKSQFKNYRHIDNIAIFLDWLKRIRFPKDLMFDSVDLYEEKNMPKVIRCLLYLGNFLSQKKLNFGIPEEPFCEFTVKFTSKIESILMNAYPVTVSAIVNHSSNLWVESDEFIVKDCVAQSRFENWNIECYNLNNVSDNSVNQESSKFLIFDHLQNLYFTKNGRIILESLLLSNIKTDIEMKYETDKEFKFLEKYKDEIIKFPSVFVDLHFGNGKENGLIIPIESLINPISSSHHIFSFVNTLIDIDDSDNFSLTLIPVMFFFKYSVCFKNLQNNVLAIATSIDSNLDPISIYYERKGKLPCVLQKHNREAMVIQVLNDPVVRNEFYRKIDHLKDSVDRIIQIIENFEYPEYFKLFINRICTLNNCTKRYAFGIHFDYIIGSFFVHTEQCLLPREILKIIFQNLNVFTEDCFFNMSESIALQFFRPLRVVSSLDYFNLAPLKEYIESKREFN